MTEFSRRGAIVDRIGLSATYALILLTVPTFGVAGVVGLASVLWGSEQEDALGRSHREYQKRTLMIALASIVIGAILIVVNVGVFVLFAMLIWTLVRGMRGLRALQQGQVIANPRGWL
ncbi:serine/threonine protein kinase [Brevundimonas sp. BH3]|uniref:serine/threonine protein kinase n=1 Tax=Brevundimonas sp. BH3 TaxID=3133089 RepID=UPI0032566D4B